MSSLCNIGLSGLREGPWRPRWRDFAWAPAPGERHGVCGGRRGAGCFLSRDSAASRSRERDSRGSASRTDFTPGWVGGGGRRGLIIVRRPPLTPALSPAGGEGVEGRAFLYADLAGAASRKSVPPRERRSSDRQRPANTPASTVRLPFTSLPEAPADLQRTTSGGGCDE